MGKVEHHTIHIQRAYEVEVYVAVRRGDGPTWWQPGEPDEAWVEGSELTLVSGEEQQAISQALAADPPTTHPEPYYNEDSKPF